MISFRVTRPPRLHTFGILALSSTSRSFSTHLEHRKWPPSRRTSVCIVTVSLQLYVKSTSLHATLSTTTTLT